MLVTVLWLAVNEVEVAVTTDAASKLHVLLHNCLALGVDGTQVGILEESHDVGFCCFLESLDGL